MSIRDFFQKSYQLQTFEPPFLHWNCEWRCASHHISEKKVHLHFAKMQKSVIKWFHYECLESNYPKTIIWAILSKLILHLYCMSTIVSFVSIFIPPKEQTGGSTLPVFSSGGFHGCKWEEHSNENSQNSLAQDQAQPSRVWALITFTLTSY